MASGAQLQSKIKAVLAKLQATPRTVKFRELIRTGGNPRLGIGGTVTYVDTLADPQPAAQLVKGEQLANTTSLVQPGDWEFTFAGSIDESMFRDKQILFGDTEVLNIVQYEPYAMNGIVVGWSVIARTVKTR